MARMLVLGLFLAAAIHSYSAPASDFSLTEQGLSPSAARLDISKTLPQHTSISLLDPGIEISNLDIGFDSYQVPIIGGEFFIPDPGVHY